MDGFRGDLYDKLRIAYRYMLLVVQFSDVMHQGVDCVGPNARIYTVDIKGYDIDPPRGTFTSRFMDRLQYVIVK